MPRVEGFGVEGVGWADTVVRYLEGRDTCDLVLNVSQLVVPEPNNPWLQISYGSTSNTPSK